MTDKAKRKALVKQACKAAQVGDNEALQRLNDEDPSILSGSDSDKRTPLHWAAASGKENTVRFLLDKGVTPNTADDAGWSPLISAASCNHVSVVQLLLGLSSIDPNQTTTGSRTALHYACSKGHDTIVELLLEQKNIKVNPVDQDGMTPLCRAVLRGSLALMRKLIQKGANINHQNRAGETPLHIACQEGNAEVVQLLLDEGVDVEVLDKQQKKAWEYVTNEALIPILKPHVTLPAASSTPASTEIF